MILKPGQICTATDVSGAQRTVEYSVLANAGSGNGVLLAFKLDGRPEVLAFGRVVGTPEKVTGTDATYLFESFTRCDPALRGQARGAVEEITLTVTR